MDELQNETSGTIVTVRGMLDSASWGANSCKIVHEGHTVDCTFPENLKPAIKNALGNWVEVIGEAIQHGSKLRNPLIKEVYIHEVRDLSSSPAVGNYSQAASERVLCDLDRLMEEEPQDVGNAVALVRQLRDATWGGRD